MDRLSLTAHWCPRCEVQSEREWHFCEKGPPLIPQLDVETRCERIEVVPADQLQGAVARADMADALARLWLASPAPLDQRYGQRLQNSLDDAGGQ